MISPSRSEQIESAAQSFINTTLIAATKNFPGESIELGVFTARLAKAVRNYRDDEERAMFVMVVAAGAMYYAASVGNNLAVSQGEQNYARMIENEIIRKSGLFDL